MIPYCIFTMCSENYKDALDFSIPSWLDNTKAQKIFIYTNFKYQHPDNRVVIIDELMDSSNWNEIVDSKSDITYKFINYTNFFNIAYLDIDCYVRSDFSEIFNSNFDIAAARMNTRRPLNAGVFFCKNTNATKMLTEKWIARQIKYKKQRKYGDLYEQGSLSDILHEEYRNSTFLRVKPVQESIYNNEGDNYDKWIARLRNTSPKIIHFKGRKWRNKVKVQKLFEGLS